MIIVPRKIQKRQNTQLRRKQIINALRKLIIEYGSENVTVRRIAKEIRVSQGAIYRHFKSKREILSFLVDYIEETLLHDVESQNRGNSILEFLEKILKNHISGIEQRRGVSFLVVAEIVSLGDKRLNKQIFEVLNKYIGHIKDILVQGIRSGEIKKDVDPDAAATIFFGLIQGMVTIWALSNYGFALEKRYLGFWNFFQQALKQPNQAG